MLKTIVSILLISGVSQAGMFDSVVNSVPSAATQAIASAPVKSSGILSSLTNSLGVTPTQASGGTAAIMQYAKSQTSPSDYSKITNGVPGLENIASSSILGATNPINSTTAVDSAFNKLGMDKSMVKQFVPIIQNYIGESGGSTSQSIITKALSAL